MSDEQSEAMFVSVFIKCSDVSNDEDQVFIRCPRNGQAMVGISCLQIKSNLIDYGSNFLN